MKTSLLSLLLAISLFCSAHEGGNFVSSDMLASMKPGEKAALLMVHFGTTHDDTRTQTIDAINAQARKAFPDLEFREAYTSRIIIRRLKTRGVVKIPRWMRYSNCVERATHTLLYKVPISLTVWKWSRSAVMWKACCLSSRRYA